MLSGLADVHWQIQKLHRKLTDMIEELRLFQLPGQEEAVSASNVLQKFLDFNEGLAEPLKEVLGVFDSIRIYLVSSQDLIHPQD